jgi:outer membrane lipoprotein-sorting protein
MVKTFYVCLIPVIIVAALAGCGPKPRPEPLPADVTLETLIQALQRQSETILTFSGWARVQVREKGDEQTTTAVVAFKRPDRYKITLLGFGGAELAEIGSEGDSITVYIPYYNGYLRSPKGINPLGALLPEAADVDVERMISVISGVTLPPGQRDNYAITLKKWEDQAELLFEREGMQYRYRVRGPRLLVTEETVLYKGETLWQVGRNDFRTQNGVPFPRRIQIRDERRTLRLDFSGFSINTELRGEELSVQIPEDAERLTIRN